MSRWEPDAHGRLQQAAVELYGERGFEQTTVAEIAERAGVTERTFFRYFTDKREVLFDGSSALLAHMVAALESTPVEVGPLDGVAAAVHAGAQLLGGGRDFSRVRHRLIAANSELMERELIKLSRLSDALAAALRRRGTGEPAASLAAEAGVAVFRIGFERWVADDESRALTAVMAEGFDQLRAVTAPQAGAQDPSTARA